MPSVPYGFCHCGCGEKTRVSSRSDTRAGTVGGRPLRFLRGHNSRLSPVEYVIDEATGCWLWQRAKYGTGYGVVRIDGRMIHAHRVLYERHVGPIPAGRELDHLCSNRACVNPDHLEPVTHAENIRRCSLTRLDVGKVGEIRQRVAAGERTMDVATAFGITQRHVYSIVKREAWADVA